MIIIMLAILAQDKNNNLIIIINTDKRNNAEKSSRFRIKISFRKRKILFYNSLFLKLISLILYNK